MNSSTPSQNTPSYNSLLEPSRDAPLPGPELSEKRTGVIALSLLAMSVAYALAATATLPHRLALADAAAVFLAGAVPGVMVTVLLWVARPEAIGPGLRRRLIAISLSGATSVALLSLVLPGLP